MIYQQTTAHGDNFVISFKYSDYPNIFEKSFADNEYFFTQEMKSWLVKNDMKVFVKYEINSDTTEFFIKFEDPMDALFFMSKFGKTEE